MLKQPRRSCEFGSFRVDLADRVLLRSGEVVPLTPKAFDTLLLLMEHNGELVEKDALMKALWPDTFVEEGNLTQNVSILRKTLGDGYIETIPRRGYRFSASVRVLPSATRHHAGFWIFISSLAAVAMLISGWALFPRSRTTSPRDYRLIPLTSDPGYEGEPTFSPDGQMIAYVSDRTGNLEIFLKQIDSAWEINLTNNPADDVQPAFSPDGQRIAFVSSRAGSAGLLYYGMETPLMGGGIWVMSALGGNATRIVESGNFPSWSPDGTTILYTVSGTWFGMKIWKVPASGGEPREVSIRFKAGELVPGYILYPSYSSDSRWVTFQGGDNIYVVPSEGGEARAIAPGSRPAWGRESRSILYSNSGEGRSHSLWQIPFSPERGETGPATPLTVGRGQDTQAAISKDGKRIAFTALDKSFNLETMPFDAEAGRPMGEPQAVTSGSHVTYFHSFSLDGRSVVFDERRTGSSHIWRVDEGSAPTPLIVDPEFDDCCPKESPDGSAIAFTRRRATEAQANRSIWLSAPDGGSRRLLVDNAAGISWLPNARSIVYLSQLDRQLHIIDLVTKSTRKITDESKIVPVFGVSPDGRWVVYQSSLAGNMDLRAVPVGGGSSRAVVATPHQDYHPVFSPSGNWLYFQPDHKNLYRVPGPAQNWRQANPERVTNFPESGLLIEDFQMSPDGHRLLYSRGHVTGDIWLIEIGK
jgi:Tol biopolymer transport system component/DNA-binding winged helix-turn-helix (wHTH) protein